MNQEKQSRLACINHAKVPPTTESAPVAVCSVHRKIRSPQQKRLRTSQQKRFHSNDCLQGRSSGPRLYQIDLTPHQCLRSHRNLTPHRHCRFRNFQDLLPHRNHLPKRRLWCLLPPHHHRALYRCRSPPPSQALLSRPQQHAGDEGGPEHHEEDEGGHRSDAPPETFL
jgi:hypothetical protein